MEERKRGRGRPVGTGRPLKSPDERFVAFTVRMPPSLVAEFRRRVPTTERAAFIRRAVEREMTLMPVTSAAPTATRLLPGAGQACLRDPGGRSGFGGGAPGG